MSFYIKGHDVDLGTLELENMFILEFMPLANGTHVKVYLLGFYYAKNPVQIYTNDTIAKTLSISHEDVCSAWSFWESKGLVECETPPNPFQPYMFSVKFQSVRELYLNHNYQKRFVEDDSKSAPVSHSSSVQRVISAMSNTELKKMFQQLEFIIKRPLTPANHIKILDWMSNFKMDPDMIERAFVITYEERPKLQDEPNIDRHFKYIESILASWFDKKVFTSDQLIEEEKKHQSKVQHYKNIYAAIGISNRSISSGDKEIVDSWSTKIDESTQLFIIKEATKRTTNPNFKYMDKIIQSAITSNVTDIQSAIDYFGNSSGSGETKASKSEPSSNPRSKRINQNFTQSTISNLSNDELNKIIQRKADRKKLKSEE